MSDLIQYLNPPTLARPHGFSHLTQACVDRLVCISGQVACDPDGNIVGAGDLAVQTRQVFINLGHALEAAGTGFDHVVKLNIYVCNISETAVATIQQVCKDFLIDTALPASTLVGVTGLAKAAFLVEVEAYALKSAPPDRVASAARALYQTSEPGRCCCVAGPVSLRRR